MGLFAVLMGRLRVLFGGFGMLAAFRMIAFSVMLGCDPVGLAAIMMLRGL
jgi:hypothetical protein